MLSPQQVSSLSHEELVQNYLLLSEKHVALSDKTIELKAQNQWLKRQLFGKKSERILPLSSCPDQLTLGAGYEPEVVAPAKKTKVKAYEKTHRKNEVKFSEDESKLKFEESVPVEVIHVANPEVLGLQEDEYEVIGEEVCHKLAQRPGAYVVLKYVRETVKLKQRGDISTAPVTPAARVIDRSLAEVSFIVGLLLDKFMYHLPLYRQHQRLIASGVHVNRMTLTNLVHRAAQLLEPVYVSVQSSILLSHALALDETPVKAGRKVKGKMHQGQLWGMYGDKDELAFLYAPTRSGNIVKGLLENFSGTIITDGYSVYERYAAQRRDVIHAQCWVHTRRKFFDAKDYEPELANKALSLIGELYQIEDKYSKKERATHATPVVDEFFSWLRQETQTRALLPSNPFTKAAAYALKRESALRVFLADEKIPLDTNHLERQIRPVAIGKKNWLFHWTETGAQYSAIIQSLIASCKLQQIDPYTYLIDVLQRIESHPMRDIHLLTPRLWKERFSQEPLLSDLSN